MTFKTGVRHCPLCGRFMMRDEIPGGFVFQCFNAGFKLRHNLKVYEMYEEVAK